MHKPIEERELQKLQETKAFITRELNRLGSLRRDSRERAMQIGKQYAEDNPFGGAYAQNWNDMDSIVSQFNYQNSMERELQAYEQAQIDLHMLQKLLLSPYFARVDFRLAQNNMQTSFYIGLKNLYDKESHKTIVSDWRAPVGDLFYNDFEGTAFYDAPRGRIEGEILLKRQFKFENGNLLYYFDAEMKINDEILGEVLAEDAKDKLKVIVSSIQREQNTAIRYLDNENLIVFGPAGSGKTSIGLHRMAYLLYKNRKHLTSRDIILFTNSNVFATYIADIIPELGEQDIVKQDFFDIVLQNIHPRYTVHDYYEQANDLLSPRAEARRTAVALKYSEAFLTFLRRHVENRAFRFPEVSVQGRTVLTSAAIRRRFESDREEYNLTQKTERLVSFCLKEIDAYFDQNETLIRAQIEAEREPFDDPKQLYRQLKHSTKQQTRSLLRENLRLDEYSLYTEALGAYCTQNQTQNIAQKTINNLNRRVLLYEDALVVLYIKSILGTLPRLRATRHVLIDEAQDLCELQHKIILYLCPGSRFTLLADPNQGILPEVNTLSKQTLRDLYGANTVELKKSYRSTRQINETALKLLSGSAYEIFNREGEEPTVLSAADQTGAILDLLHSGRLKGKSTCIITKTTAHARRLYEDLRARSDAEIHLIDERTETFASGIMVMPLVFTKGLEFDNVIIPFADSLCSRTGENRQLYLMVTRALHRLFVLFKEQPLFPFANQ